MERREEAPMNCFPMLSEAYVAALLASEGAERDAEAGDVGLATSDAFPEESGELRDPDDDLENAPTRPLRLDALHL
jgi:hypothetical protein